LPKNQEEIDKNYMKRLKVNDPVAIFKTGEKCHRQGDIEGAFQYWRKAARMGHIMAHYNLSVLYHEGGGVEKDPKKELYHLEEAAIGGHPTARYNLGCIEIENGRGDRAKKHFLIAAKLGDDKALGTVKKGFMKGLVSKEEYAAALRGHQAAVDATKSQQGEEAEKAGREGLYSYAFY
jgi:TPR repeat protein